MKLTNKDVHEIYLASLRYKSCKMSLDDFSVLIASILDRPEPEQGAEEKISTETMQLLSDVFDKHSLKNKMFVPLLDSMRFVKAAEEYAAPLRAEVDRLKKELFDLKLENGAK